MAAKYRLEALLRVKQREKKKAERLLAGALLALRDAKEKLKKLERERKEIQVREKETHRKMDQEMVGGGLIQRGCFFTNFLRKLKEDEAAKVEEIENQKGVIKECETKVAKARKEYYEAIRQLRTMEKHKGLWAKKVRLELNRREEKQMDELGQTVYGLRKWRGEKSEFQVE